MKTILSVILLALMPLVAFSQPPGNKNAQIELPGDMEISSKQRSVKITAKTEGEIVLWTVIGTAPGLDIQFDDIGNKSIRLYPNDADEEIIVLAHTTVMMKATPAVSMIVKVLTGQKPIDPGKPVDPVKPDPGPEPNGPKSGKIAAHTSMVVDSEKQTQEIVSVLNDAGLRTWLANMNIRLHSPVDIRSTVVTRPKGLASAVQAAGGPPCCVIQDAQGNVIDQARITSVAQVKSLIARHTK